MIFEFEANYADQIFLQQASSINQKSFWEAATLSASRAVSIFAETRIGAECSQEPKFF